jgi:hypothetical protein
MQAATWRISRNWLAVAPMQEERAAAKWVFQVSMWFSPDLRRQ